MAEHDDHVGEEDEKIRIGPDPDAEELDTTPAPTRKELQHEAELRIEDVLPPRPYGDEVPVLDEEEHPIGVINEDTDLVENGGEDLPPVVAREDVHNDDESIHVAGEGDHVDPPQEGESEPVDLEALIQKEQRDRLELIKESPIGNPVTDEE